MSERRREQESSPARYVRQELRTLDEYGLELTDCRHKLDQNEVPWDLPARFKREAARRLLARNWARYPDFHADVLRRRLAELHGWQAAGVLVGNGSNELLGVALEALAGPGTEVLGAEPTFGLYEMMARRSGARMRFLPPAEHLGLPIQALRAEIERDPRRPLLLCSPNNPTGAAATPEQVEALLAALDAPLLLDNAYGEFCRWDYRPLLRRHRHLVVLRTFSKAWSLAGARLGYLLADPDLVRELVKVKLPYNLSHAAIALGEVALEHPGHTRRAVAVLRGRREQWRTALESVARLELQVFPSEGNFLLVRSPQARPIRDGLRRRGILVREVGHYPHLAGCLRFGVGSGPALRDTIAALEQIGGELGDDPNQTLEPTRGYGRAPGEEVRS
ncbi:MAG TPA: histidinol-phosphate transaminase [Thermoanaerobaculia bacterium]|nr:histidinol-phosphate transaminase [Thermoanaerobaculia bacterium]